MNRQRGFTLIEIILVLALAGVVMTFAARGARTALFEGRLESLQGEVSKILEAGERARRSAITTTVEADGSYTHTYPTLPAGSTIADLDALFPSGSARVPDRSPYGTEYFVEIGADTVSVTVDVPVAPDLQVIGATSVNTTNDDGDITGSRLTFTYAGAMRPAQMAVPELLYEKAIIYNETAR